MAAKIFSDSSLLQQVNNLVHPAVKQYILDAIESENQKGTTEFFFLEAALLIEGGYKTIVDEMWYIYADESVREKRLKENRGYDSSRIRGIMKSQLSKEQFQGSCDRVIDNSDTIEAMQAQIDTILGDPLWRTQKHIMDN